MTYSAPAPLPPSPARPSPSPSTTTTTATATAKTTVGPVEIRFSFVASSAPPPPPQEASLYPTPPPSPDLIELFASLPEQPQPAENGSLDSASSSSAQSGTSLRPISAQVTQHAAGKHYERLSSDQQQQPYLEPESEPEPEIETDSISPASAASDTLLTPPTPSQARFDDFFTSSLSLDRGRDRNSKSLVYTFDDSETHESEQSILSTASIDTSSSAPATASVPAPPPLPQPPASPIPLTLSGQSQVPYAASLRLKTSSSLLGVLGGLRVLSLDAQSLLQRMPYTAAAINMPRDRDEDVVEALLGGPSTADKSNPLLDSSIYVHPPTPDREVPPAAPPPTNYHAKLPFRLERVSSASAIPTLPSQPMSSQVLPEVRSPPRNTLSMAADSLQITHRRGRRPRLFGFTELGDSSGSSANSSRTNSRNNSRDNSPDRPHSPLSLAFPPSGQEKPILERRNSPTKSRSTSSPSHHVHYDSSSFQTHHTQHDISSTHHHHTYRPEPARAPSDGVLPRRPAVRARSDMHLKTLQHHAPRSRRENGLKLDFSGIIQIPPPQEVQSAIIPSPYSAQLIRKKSGEILKPALKYAGPLAANGTPLNAPDYESGSSRSESQERPRFESKSCPTTPSCPKYVHFDAHLERVKVFRGDQKPQVVSRDGSPTEYHTTSASEGEEFPFPSTDEDERDKRVLQIKLPNFNTNPPADSDLYLESLFLDDDRKTLKGMIMCKNFAFQKWVAVRFTFDWWQTTSEVTATFKDSVKAGKYDRFSFTIKLQDLLAKIEEKSLFLAIRYNSDGKELWDSNGGQNYQVTFERTNPVRQKKLTAARAAPSIQPGMGKAVGGRTSQWTVAGGQDDRLADLRAKLERMSADDAISPPGSPGGAKLLSPARRNGSSNGDSIAISSPRKSSSALETNAMPDLPAAGSGLATRYNFGAAFKNERRNSNSPSPSPRPADLPDLRTGLISFGQRLGAGHASNEFYSPRFSPNTLPDSPLPATDGFFSPNSRPVTTFSPHTMPAETVPSVPPPSAAKLSLPQVHVQGPSPPPDEDFEPTPTSAPKQLDDVPVLTSTMPASEMATATEIKMPTPVLPQNGSAIGLIDGLETSPAPSLETSGSVTDTPSESPKSPPDETLPRWSPTSRVERQKSGISLASYSSLVEQFCWGGTSSPMENKRSHSTSELDSYFASPVGSPTGAVTPRPSRPATYHAYSYSYDGTPPSAALSQRSVSELSNSSTTLTPSRRSPPSSAYSRSAAATPSSLSSSSYYTSYSTPTRAEMDMVEDVMRSGTSGSDTSSPGSAYRDIDIGALTMGMSHPTGRRGVQAA